MSRTAEYIEAAAKAALMADNAAAGPNFALVAIANALVAIALIENEKVELMLRMEDRAP